MLHSQIDGLSWDLDGKTFFKKGGAEHLVTSGLWEGHSTGLPRVAAVLSADRPLTIDEQIEVPYRHGAAHGRDLGYGSPANCTKLFLLVLSLARVADQRASGLPDREPAILLPEPGPMTWDELKVEVRRLCRLLWIRWSERRSSDLGDRLIEAFANESQR